MNNKKVIFVIENQQDITATFFCYPHPLWTWKNILKFALFDVIKLILRIFFDFLFASTSNTTKTSFACIKKSDNFFQATKIRKMQRFYNSQKKRTKNMQNVYCTSFRNKTFIVFCISHGLYIFWNFLTSLLSFQLRRKNSTNKLFQLWNI